MVEFYFHTPLESTNERHAIFRLARRLYQKYGHLQSPHLLLIANIDPGNQPHWQQKELTQLDALLLGDNFIALIDFKECKDPFDGTNIEDYWYILNEKKQKTGIKIHGGKAKNPVKQMRVAKYRWGNFFEEQLKPTLTFWQSWGLNKPQWAELNGVVLFCPTLHPETRLPDLKEDKKWLHLVREEHILEMTFAFQSSLKFSVEQKKFIAEQILKAQPEPELMALLSRPIGNLIIELNNQREKEIALYPYETVLVGRSSECQIQVDDMFSKVSKKHLRIETYQSTLRIFDNQTSNGTFLDGEKIDSEAGRFLQENQILLLGGREKKDSICRITYEPNELRLPGQTHSTNISL